MGVQVLIVHLNLPSFCCVRSCWRGFPILFSSISIWKFCCCECKLPEDILNAKAMWQTWPINFASGTQLHLTVAENLFSALFTLVNISLSTSCSCIPLLYNMEKGGPKSVGRGCLKLTKHPSLGHGGAGLSDHPQAPKRAVFHIAFYAAAIFTVASVQVFCLQKEHWKMPCK